MRTKKGNYVKSELTGSMVGDAGIFAAAQYHQWQFVQRVAFNARNFKVPFLLKLKGVGAQ